MKTNDKCVLSGNLDISINGEAVLSHHNMIMTVGKNWIADRMADSGTVIANMSVGTDNTAEADSQTDLFGKIATVGLTTVGGVVTNNTIVYTATLPAGTGTGALVEAGLFNTDGTPVMLARSVFLTINKGADDEMTITWTVTIA